MKKLVIYYRDGSRQVVTPRQEVEKYEVINGKRILISTSNFCGDWYQLAQAISGGNYLKYEVV